MKRKLKSFFEIFTEPDKIINYAKEKWSSLKYSLIVMISGLLFGFNFFWSNFIVKITPNMALLIILMLCAGWIVISFFSFLYLLLIWSITRTYLYINKRNNTSESIKESDKNPMNTLTKNNLYSWVKTFSFCLVIPFLIYNIIEFILNIFLISIDLIYVVVYIKDYGKFLLYAWIISLTLYSTQDMDKEQKYKINAIILISFVTAYLIVSLLNFYAAVFITDFLT